MSIDPEHVEAAHRVTVIQTDEPGAPLHLCSVCKAATYFQAPELPCPGPVAPIGDHAALLAALVRAGVLTEEHRDCCSTCGAGYGSCENIDEACTDAEWIEQRRYMSKWEETCD